MISPKQKLILAFPFTEYRALICDGAVRSGKTSMQEGALSQSLREMAEELESDE